MTNKSKPFIIPEDLGNKPIKLGIIPSSKPSIGNYNVGNSDYSKHIIQPWSIWQDYNLSKKHCIEEELNNNKNN